RPCVLSSTLVPYTTLFRSDLGACELAGAVVAGRRVRRQGVRDVPAHRLPAAHLQLPLQQGRCLLPILRARPATEEPAEEPWCVRCGDRGGERLDNPAQPRIELLRSLGDVTGVEGRPQRRGVTSGEREQLPGGGRDGFWWRVGRALLRRRDGERDLAAPGVERGAGSARVVSDRLAGREQVRGVLEQLLSLPQEFLAFSPVQLSHRAPSRRAFRRAP